MAPLLKCCVFTLLAFFFALVPVWAGGSQAVLQRQKREWISAPRQLKENHDYTGLRSIARIRSDKENFTKIYYEIFGPGVEQPPVRTFGVEPDTGFVKIYRVLDRENIPFYHLIGKAKYPDGTMAEKDIDLKITVLDENDCPPIITANQVGSVSESSAEGTTVMRVIATDADQENTAHTKIRYSLVEQGSSAGRFFINSQTGDVMVLQNTLDRERQDSYKLMIKASDLDGRAGGNTGSGEVEIKILDINDNIPTLERDSYEGSVEENTINTEVMRIKALDMDLINTDNWLAVFDIVSGNEAGYFSISTDAKTNEGVIMIRKALDYEELKVVNLGVAVSNKAQYNFGSGFQGGSIAQKSYPIQINVANQKEGPRFHPSVKVVTLSEDSSSISLYKTIATYAAIDSDTLKTATNVRYAKIHDEDNWLSIDEKTADIKLNKLPDRESKYLINGTYYAQIICITNDSPSKTATGTIAIQVEDFNDHCPTLTSTSQTMCLEDNAIYVTAIDEDDFPNSAPFEFTVIPGRSDGDWIEEPLNKTSVILRDQSNLWPGIYKVAVQIKDQQGKSCVDDQVMNVIVCNCDENTRSCVPHSTSTSSLGPLGVLLLLLGLLLLLLLPLLLLFCLCGGAAAMGNFKPIPYDTKQQLISYHTEGQGEDKKVPLLHAPVEVGAGTMKAKNIHGYGERGYLGGLVELGGGAGYGINTSTMTAEDMHLYNQYNQSSGRVEVDYSGGAMLTGQQHLFDKYRSEAFDGMALSDEFLGEYYSSKSSHAAQQFQQKDSFLAYDYEGQESLAGSVGCCSLLDNNDDLAFLNDLGPKFKTLAEICHGSALVTETMDTRVSVSPPRPVSPYRPSISTHTHVHTDRETFQDRDHVNINTINTSNVMFDSSNIIQESQAQASTTIPKVHVQNKVMVPSQPLLVQQPTMYYAATPMYVVEPQNRMVLVAGAPQQAVGQIGQIGLSQGVVQVGGLQSSQGVVLVDTQAGLGGVTGQVAQGLSHGTISRARQVLVEDGSSGGEQVVHLTQGVFQTERGSAEQGLELRRQGRHAKTQSSQESAGPSVDLTFTARPKLQGSQKVVVQRKKVSVTERNVQSSTRA
ncbi:desmoglein-2-like protein [Brachionichthys hirsutus]|uniref:desmoglein-2-like protein n=1 Tax=Brachionichthys hirsutus TaxID=412623 RepID=UPI00360510E3